MDSKIGMMFVYDEYIKIYNNLVIIITEESNLQFNEGQNTSYYDNGYDTLIELGLLPL